MKPLQKLGWSHHQEEAWREYGNKQFVPGRVIADYGSNLRIAIPEEKSAEVSGRMQYMLEPYEMPKVGDWVAVQIIDDGTSIIHEVLPRKSEISRKQAGSKIEKQVLAANVDTAFLVQSLDDDFSPERMQRYLFQLAQASIEAILILNKADRADDVRKKLDELKSFSQRIIVTSTVTGQGLSELAEAIKPGKTAVFLGSSGVGKSTITNYLLGEDKQVTRATREADSKGRHTTTHRELFVLPNGGLIIDTPGLRELQLWGTEDNLDSVFADIEMMSKACRFTNCTHTSEPGCAVQSGIREGSLDESRLKSYFKLKKELHYLDTKTDETSALERKHEYKKSQKQFNQAIRSKSQHQ